MIETVNCLLVKHKNYFLIHPVHIYTIQAKFYAKSLKDKNYTCHKFICILYV